MDTTVVIMIISIYSGAVLAPLGVFAAARRTGHGPAWQAAPIACAVVIWLVLGLGFAREFLGVTFVSDFLERIAFLAVVAMAVLAGLGFALAVKRWPRPLGRRRIWTAQGTSQNQAGSRAIG